MDECITGAMKVCFIGVGGSWFEIWDKEQIASQLRGIGSSLINLAIAMALGSSQVRQVELGAKFRLGLSRIQEQIAQFQKHAKKPKNLEFPSGSVAVDASALGCHWLNGKPIKALEQPLIHLTVIASAPQFACLADLGPVAAATVLISYH
ncbi:hypothetical protein VNO77_03052 [Canavalia gladiata]|uniref:Uncharacterized protein n=1 Tax=Canavalia gladiata TaxID=3824 RepID=A0AAN9N0J1_CANGL